jgi:hypothetical protein
MESKMHLPYFYAVKLILIMYWTNGDQNFISLLFRGIFKVGSLFEMIFHALKFTIKQDPSGAAEILKNN